MHEKRAWGISTLAPAPQKGSQDSHFNNGDIAPSESRAFLSNSRNSLNIVPATKNDLRQHSLEFWPTFQQRVRGTAAAMPMRK